MRAEHDPADGRDEQHDRRDLEREQVIGEENVPIDAGEPNARVMGAGSPSESPASSPIATITSTSTAPPASAAPIAIHDGPPAHGASSVRSPR